MELALTNIMIIVYLGLFVLYIFLLVKIWKACTAIIEMKSHVIEMKSHVKDISFRDTTRFVSEINNGTITEADLKEGRESFNAN